MKEAIQTRSLVTIKVEALSFRYSSTPNVKDKTGTPLLFCADDIQIAEYLVENSKGGTLLHYNANQSSRCTGHTRMPQRIF